MQVCGDHWNLEKWTIDRDPVFHTHTTHFLVVYWITTYRLPTLMSPGKKTQAE